MTTKHKPATPLPQNHGGTRRPWYLHGPIGEATHVMGADHSPVAYATATMPRELAPENAAYIAHAANAYPRLVEALREQLQAYEGDFGPQHISTRHRALLRELGEL